MHWTCKDGFAGIQHAGVIRPNRHPLLGVALAWFTDMSEIADDGDRRALGLTSAVLGCDRTAYRFIVPAPYGVGIVTWSTFARTARLPLGARAVIEGAPGSRPRQWWVSSVEVRPIGYMEGAR